MGEGVEGGESYSENTCICVFSSLEYGTFLWHEQDK